MIFPKDLKEIFWIFYQIQFEEIYNVIWNQRIFTNVLALHSIDICNKSSLFNRTPSQSSPTIYSGIRTTGAPGRFPGTCSCGNYSIKWLGRPNAMEIIFTMARSGSRTRAT